MKAMNEGLKHIAWRQQVASCQAMIESIDELVTLQPQGWKDGMLRYWVRNLEQLVDREPLFWE